MVHSSNVITTLQQNSNSLGHMASPSLLVLLLLPLIIRSLYNFFLFLPAPTATGGINFKFPAVHILTLSLTPNCIFLKFNVNNFDNGQHNCQTINYFGSFKFNSDKNKCMLINPFIYSNRVGKIILFSYLLPVLVFCF